MEKLENGQRRMNLWWKKVVFAFGRPADSPNGVEFVDLPKMYPQFANP